MAHKDKSHLRMYFYTALLTFSLDALVKRCFKDLLSSNLGKISMVVKKKTCLLRISKCVSMM